MSETKNAGLAVAAGEGERIRSPVGGDITFIVRGSESKGALAALEALAPPGEGPPLHIHTREDETIYILEGEFRWRLGDEDSTTGPGAFVFVPRGLAHTWQCLGNRPGKMLITFSPAGMDRFFESLSSLDEVDPEAFRRAGAEHGMDVIGPPLAVSDPL